jgi:hypothetical protein
LVFLIVLRAEAPIMTLNGKSQLEGLTWGLRTRLALWPVYLPTGATVEVMLAGAPRRIEFDEDTNHG